jgi:hypothetical protein
MIAAADISANGLDWAGSLLPHLGIGMSETALTDSARSPFPVTPGEAHGERK